MQASRTENGSPRHELEQAFATAVALDDARGERPSVRRRLSKLRYDRSDKGRARRRRYNKSEKGRARRVAHYLRRVAEGRCVKCGELAISETRCWDCLSKLEAQGQGLNGVL
jgi:hypothetical protein